MSRGKIVQKSATKPRDPTAAFKTSTSGQDKLGALANPIRILRLLQSPNKKERAKGLAAISGHAPALVYTAVNCENEALFLEALGKIDDQKILGDVVIFCKDERRSIKAIERIENDDILLDLLSKSAGRDSLGLKIARKLNFLGLLNAAKMLSQNPCFSEKIKRVVATILSSMDVFNPHILKFIIDHADSRRKKEIGLAITRLAQARSTPDIITNVEISMTVILRSNHRPSQFDAIFALAGQGKFYLLNGLAQENPAPENIDKTVIDYIVKMLAQNLSLLKDDTLFETIVRLHKDVSVRIRALEKIFDPEILDRIANSKIHPKIKTIAQQRYVQLEPLSEFERGLLRECNFLF